MKNTTGRRVLFTPRQLAEMTGVKIDHILAWIHSGELKASNTAKDANGQRPRWRIHIDDLRAFLDARANQKMEAIQPVKRRRRNRPKPKQWV